MHTLNRHQDSFILHPSGDRPLAVADCDDYGSSSDNERPRTRPTAASRSASALGHHTWPSPDTPFEDGRSGASPSNNGLPVDAFTNAGNCPVPSSDCNEPQIQKGVFNAHDSQNEGRNSQPFSYMQDDGCAQSSSAQTLNLDLSVVVEEESVFMQQDVYNRASSAGAQPTAAGSVRFSQEPFGRRHTSAAGGLTPRPPRPAAPPHASAPTIDDLNSFLCPPEPYGRGPNPPEPSKDPCVQSASCSSASNQPRFHGSQATAAAAAAATAAAAAGTSAVLHPGRHQNGDLKNMQTGSAAGKINGLAVFRSPVAPEPHGQQQQLAAATGASLRTSLEAAAAAAATVRGSKSASPFGPVAAATAHSGHIAPAAGHSPGASRLTVTAAVAAAATATAASGIYFNCHPVPSHSNLRICRGCGSGNATVLSDASAGMPYPAQTNCGGAAARQPGMALQPLYLRPESPFDWGLQLPRWEEGPGDLFALSTAQFEQRMEGMNREAWTPAPARYVFRPLSMLGRWLSGDVGAAAAATVDVIPPSDGLATAAIVGLGPGHVAAKLAVAAAHAASASAMAAGAGSGHPSRNCAGVGLLRGIATAAGASASISAYAGGSVATAFNAAADAGAEADVLVSASGQPQQNSGLQALASLLTQHPPVTLTPLPTMGATSQPFSYTSSALTLGTMEPAVAAFAGRGGGSNGQELGAQPHNALGPVPCYKPTKYAAVSERLSLDSRRNTVGGLLATVARLAAEGAPRTGRRGGAGGAAAAAVTDASAAVTSRFGGAWECGGDSEVSSGLIGKDRDRTYSMDDDTAGAAADSAEICSRRSPPLKRRLDDLPR